MYVLDVLYCTKEGETFRGTSLMRIGPPLVKGTQLGLQDRQGRRYEGEVNSVIVHAVEQHLEGPSVMRCEEIIVNCTVREKKDDQSGPKEGRP
jgi:putative aminopeptidase FrvX